VGGLTGRSSKARFRRERSGSQHRSDAGFRIVVVGAGTRFLSGISYYTIRLANALVDRYSVGVVTLRQILPTRLYPGRSRVGAVHPLLEYDPAVRELAPVDWYWLPSLPRAVLGLARFRPDFVVFEWWTGTVLHTYVALAIIARAFGAKVLVEFHEVLDTGEDRIAFARFYVGILGPMLVKLAAGFVIHSEADREPILGRYRLGRKPCVVIPHGPYDHHLSTIDQGGLPRDRKVPADVVNLLFFGVIRPFKGLEDLVRAFDGLSDVEVRGYWLTVVGETWEGWDLPIDLIKASRHRARITLVNRYVDDSDVAQFFDEADAVVLPYHRSSASGPAHVAMSHGVPLVITAVGGLPAAVEGYEGAVLVPPRDPAALRDAIRSIPQMAGRRFSDPHSWQVSAALYGDLFVQLQDRPERA
jgi:glycosyltransferase involved in cell wall biosynthesis